MSTSPTSRKTAHCSGGETAASFPHGVTGGPHALRVDGEGRTDTDHGCAHQCCRRKWSGGVATAGTVACCGGPPVIHHSACRSRERKKGVLDKSLLMRYRKLGYFKESLDDALRLGSTGSGATGLVVHLYCSQHMIGCGPAALRPVDGWVLVMTYVSRMPSGPATMQNRDRIDPGLKEVNIIEHPLLRRVIWTRRAHCRLSRQKSFTRSQHTSWECKLYGQQNV